MQRAKQKMFNFHSQHPKVVYIFWKGFEAADSGRKQVQEESHCRCSFLVGDLVVIVVFSELGMWVLLILLVIVVQQCMVSSPMHDNWRMLEILALSLQPKHLIITVALLLFLWIHPLV